MRKVLTVECPRNPAHRMHMQMPMQVVMIDHTNVQGQSTNYLESLMQGDDNSIVIVSGTHHSSST